MTVVTVEIFKSVEPLAYLSKFLESGIRPNGRKFSERRANISVAENAIINSSVIGSASASIGNTSVVVGITAERVLPIEGMQMAQRNGKININSDFSLAFPGERRSCQLQGGAFSHKLQTVMASVFDCSQLIDDVVMEDAESETTSKSNKPVFDLTVSVLIVNDDGSLFDCAVMALVRAISTTTLPNGKILSLRLSPASFTFCTYKNSTGHNVFLFDPTADEERVLQKIVLAVDETKKDVLCCFGIEGPVDGSSRSLFSTPDVVREVWPIVQEKIAYPERRN